MAKNSTGSKNPSRIRFVMVEAELGDGDIGQITQAITNALRGPAPVVVKRIASSTPAPPSNGEQQVEPDDVVESDEELDAVDVTPPAPKQRGPRKPAPKPNVIDLDVTTEPSLASYVAKINPKSLNKRYLVLAAWLHDHRETGAVTVDHIYTCYRRLNWSIDIADFSAPLRALKHQQYFTTPERGKYAINQLGLAKAMEANTD
jgi:hypothetical protein